MRRNLDLAALRSFVAVAEAGGVTRAANFLNLTQSAVSMQMKRLEEALGTPLLDRSARQVALTGAGEQLLGYGRKMIALNDEAVARMTGTAHEGTLRLGVPHDIVYPHVPRVLQRMAAEFPRLKVELESSNTIRLRDLFARGECDVILTTEDSVGPEGETLARVPMIWIGAPRGTAWTRRPVPLAFETACRFRITTQEALEAAGLDWEMTLASPSSRAVEASLSADLAVSTALAGTVPSPLIEVAHRGDLPALPTQNINLYAARADRSGAAARCAALLRMCYGAGATTTAAEAVADEVAARAG